MIPTMILFGLCFGRWWRTALVAAAVIWPLILLVNDVMGLEWSLLSAGALAVANTLGWVLAHQAVLGAVRRLYACRAFAAVNPATDERPRRRSEGSAQDVGFMSRAGPAYRRRSPLTARAEGVVVPAPQRRRGIARPVAKARHLAQPPAASGRQR